jgi:RNA polymerase sigma-70 factor (sigma-E family)
VRLIRAGARPGTDAGPLGRPSAPESADEALSALFLGHSRALVGLARLLVDDLATAEDVVQDAFAATYRRWTSIRSPDAALPYLRAAVVNQARKRLRDRQHGARVSALDPVDRADPDSATDALEHQHVVLAALRRLPPRQRQVVVLRYYLDLTESQIADQLGLTRGAVHRHATRAAATLRTRLDLGEAP